MIEIDDIQNKKQITAEIKNLMIEVIEFSFKYIDFEYDYEIGVTITDNPGIRELNRKYRNIDRETDVLSFPMLDFENGPYSRVYNFTEDISPETGKVIVGDIVLSLEMAELQAMEYGHSYDREISFLIVHSVLHLMGYDHIDESDRVCMRKKEEEILNELKLTR